MSEAEARQEFAAVDVPERSQVKKVNRRPLRKINS
jgi:hypothetical protein